jgi:hypothetical protein
MTTGDGAGSPIRKQLGLGWEGTSNLQHLVNIHFKAPLLGQCLLSSPAMLYFVYSPQSVLVLVAHDLRTGMLFIRLGCAMCEVVLTSSVAWIKSLA